MVASDYEAKRAELEAVIAGAEGEFDRLIAGRDSLQEQIRAQMSIKERAMKALIHIAEAEIAARAEAPR